MEEYGEPVTEQKARCEQLGMYVEKFHFYLKLVDTLSHNPGDIVATREIRQAKPYLCKTAPCLWAWGIEGKEKPWWDALYQAWVALSVNEKACLSMLTSDVESEWTLARILPARVLETPFI